MSGGISLTIPSVPDIRIPRMRRGARKRTPLRRLTVHEHIKITENGPLYKNTVTGTAAPSPLLTVPNVTAHPSTASEPTLFYSM